MKVKKISVANVEVSSLPKLLDEEKIGFQPVSKVNSGLLIRRMPFYCISR